MVKQLPRLIPFPGAPARGEAPEGAETAEAAAIAEDIEATEATEQRAARTESLEQTLAAVRSRWGYGSIVRLDRAGALAGAAQRARRPQSTRELPPWWPRPVGPDGGGGGGGVLRPHLIEVVGEPGSGRLTLALAWLAAARPALAAIVDTGAAATLGSAFAAKPPSGDPRRRRSQTPQSPAARRPERFYPPAAAGAGVDLTRLVVVCPPADDPRAPLDAVVVLLRSEAFDAILCPLPAGARIGVGFGAKLATFAARAGASLLLLTQPGSQPSALPAPQTNGGAGNPSPGSSAALGAFADYRVRLAGRRWLWEDGELAGVKLRAATERARAAAMAQDSAGGAVEHELTFHLHRRVRYGASAADRLALTTSTRLPNAAADQAAETDVAWPAALAGSGSG